MKCCTHTHTHTCTHACAHTCAQVHTQARTHTRTHICTPAHTHACVCPEQHGLNWAGPCIRGPFSMAVQDPWLVGSVAAEPQTGRGCACRGLAAGYTQVSDCTENWCAEAPVLFKSQPCVCLCVCVYSPYMSICSNISHDIVER